MTVESDLLGAIEVHSVEAIRQILDERFDVRTLINGKSVVTHLTEMYTRSDRFPDCLRLLLERGAHLDDPRIGPVLLDDADGLAAALRHDPSLIEHRTTMVSAFTPLVGASLLHVAAEFGNVQAARVLVDMGAGLLPQVHRDEREIHDNIRLLLEAAGRNVPPFRNVPNRYLHR